MKTRTHNTLVIAASNRGEVSSSLTTPFSHGGGFVPASDEASPGRPRSALSKLRHARRYQSGVAEPREDFYLEEWPSPENAKYTEWLRAHFGT